MQKHTNDITATYVFRRLPLSRYTYVIHQNIKWIGCGPREKGIVYTFPDHFETRKCHECVLLLLTHLIKCTRTSHNEENVPLQPAHRHELLLDTHTIHKPFIMNAEKVLPLIILRWASCWFVCCYSYKRDICSQRVLWVACCIRLWSLLITFLKVLLWVNKLLMYMA